MSDVSLQVRVDCDWARDLLGRKSTTGVIVGRTRQTLAETYVLFADARCVMERRSGVLRFDSKSVHKLGNSVT